MSVASIIVSVDKYVTNYLYYMVSRGSAIDHIIATKKGLLGPSLVAERKEFND